MKRFLNSLKKLLINGGLFLLIGLFTYHTVFATSDFHSILHLASQSRIEFLLCGLTMIALMLCAETWTVSRNLKLLGEKQSFFQCLFYTFTGNFFSGITPAATGGQPMEIYMMHKKGVSAINGTLALGMDLACYQLAVTLLGCVGYLSFGRMIHRVLGPHIWLLWMGLALNIGLLLLLLCAMFSKRFIFRLTKIAVGLVSLFSNAKAVSFHASANAAIAQYQASAELFRQNKLYCLINGLITIVRILAMHSAPFWVYKALGLSGASFVQIVALQSALYISCAALPFPGGIGIAENSFLQYFKTVFPSGLLHTSMIMSRGIGSYLTIALCGSILMAGLVTSHIRKKLRSGKEVIGNLPSRAISSCRAAAQGNPASHCSRCKSNPM